MEYYNWILVFHVMSFASWMAVLFYLPRLFIYHVEHKDNGSAFTDVIEIQERKLYSFIGVGDIDYWIGYDCFKSWTF